MSAFLHGALIGCFIVLVFCALAGDMKQQSTMIAALLAIAFAVLISGR